ncbi:MAG TPA: DUF222 domain-containing protein [Nocardioides sp.]|uniref:HNH endonuclease signature motif containing protein n=1 Tax=Nocardioides sp. TaxID=35761 RepID=UPI002EDBB0BB
MTIAFAPNTPVLLACVEVLEEALDAVAESDPIFLATDEKADALRRLAKVDARLAELRMRFLVASGDVDDAVGARDVAAWLAAETRQDLPAPRGEQQLAVALDREDDVLRRALRDGHVNLAQARVIATALDDLPDDLDPAIRQLAEKTLVAEAEHLTPHQLRIAGRRILDVAAPGIAEAEEARRLAAQEAHARARTKLSLKRLGDGTTRLAGVIPDAAAHRLETYLQAYTNPRVGGARVEPTDAFTGSYPRRLGQAFCQLLETMDPSRLPVHGGDATTVIVTIGLEQLQHDLGVGSLLDGDRLSAGEIRRLACTGTIIPAVLGARSEVLDLGRGQRLFGRAQRKALLLRDTTCRAEGCTIPGRWCEAHHWLAWTHGGRTDLANAGLLCSHHHHRAHDPGYLSSRLPNGDVRFSRRR